MQQTSTPKPSVSFVVTTIVVLVASLDLLAFQIAGLAVAWNHITRVGSGVLALLQVVFVVQQYRGTFHRNAGAARTASRCLLIVGGLASVGLVVFVSEALLGSGSAALMIPVSLLMVACFFIIGAVSLMQASMNRSWSRRLQAASDGANAVSHQKTSAWEWLVAAVSIACVAVLAMYYASTDLGQFGEHVSRDKAPGGLPADATDISFCFGYRGIIAYEFSTDEQEFVEWVNSGIGSIESRAANVKIVPISEPISITRYNFLSDELTGPGTATISDGLYYRWNKEDEEVFAAYDRTLGRAYYYSHGF